MRGKMANGQTGRAFEPRRSGSVQRPKMANGCCCRVAAAGKWSNRRPSVAYLPPARPAAQLTADCRDALTRSFTLPTLPRHLKRPSGWSECSAFVCYISADVTLDSGGLSGLSHALCGWLCNSLPNDPTWPPICSSKRYVHHFCH